MSKTGNKVPTFEVEEVQYDILRPSGHILEGTLTVPKDSQKPGPLMIFLHGTHSNRNHNFVPELCTKLVKDHGIRSYRFDFRVGPTEAEPDHRYKFSGYNDDLNDLECVVQSLVQAGFQICGIFGHSRGANDALLYASSRLIKDRTIVGDDDDRACANTVFQQMTTPQTSASLKTESVVSSSSASSSESISLTDDMQKLRLEAPSTPASSDASSLLNPAKLMIVLAAPRNVSPTVNIKQI